MPIDPRSQNEVYNSLRSRLTGKIAKLTNFVETSFNYVWTRAFSQELSDYEVKLLAAQLSGWVDYAGGPIDEDDLAGLNLGYRNADRINEFMEDQHLDELAKLMDVERFEGQKATGKLTINTATDSVQIEEGTEFGTQPDNDGYLSFFVDADGDGEISGSATVSPDSGETTVTVDIIAEEIGTDYNVGAGQITYMPSPPLGVESVSNPQATSGGLNRQDNESLREDVKQAIFVESGGGTTDGIRGYIQDNVTGVNDGDVIVDQFTTPCPPYVDVIVDGGSKNDVLDAIEASRPAGIMHNLVRPSILQIGVYAEVEGSNIDRVDVEQAIEDYLLGLQLGDDVIRDRIIQKILNADDDITNITTLEVTVERVTHEPHEYVSGASVYGADYQMLDNGLDDFLDDDSGDSYAKGTDYTDVDTDGDSQDDAIDWSIGGSQPDDGELFFLDYDAAYTVPEDLAIDIRQRASPDVSEIQVVNA